MKKMIILSCLLLIACGGVKKKDTGAAAGESDADKAKKAAAAKQAAADAFAKEVETLKGLLKDSNSAGNATKNVMAPRYEVSIKFSVNPTCFQKSPKDGKLSCVQAAGELTCDDGEMKLGKNMSDKGFIISSVSEDKKSLVILTGTVDADGNVTAGTYTGAQLDEKQLATCITKGEVTWKKV